MILVARVNWGNEPSHAKPDLETNQRELVLELAKARILKLTGSKKVSSQLSLYVATIYH